MSRIATQLPENFADQIALNAGVLLSTFDTESWTVTRSNIIGATSGGINFTDTPEYTDFGEDIDNCPKNTKELKQITSREIKVSGTFVTADGTMAKRLIGGADGTALTLTPRDTLDDSKDFETLWLVVDYGSNGAIAIEMSNALSTAGFAIQTTDKAKATFAFEFTAHYSLDDPDTVPYKIYMKSAS